MSTSSDPATTTGRSPLPPIPDMPPASSTCCADHSPVSGSADAASAPVAATSTAAAPVDPTPPPLPLHLIPPGDIQQMLEYQAKALSALRASNARFVSFHEYASRSYDSLHSLHAARVLKVRALRDALMDVFVRVRHCRMRLHERTPGAAPYREEEDAEAAEVEQLKLDLRAEEEERLAREALRRAQQEQDALVATVGAHTSAHPHHTSSSSPLMPAAHSNTDADATLLAAAAASLSLETQQQHDPDSSDTPPAGSSPADDDEGGDVLATDRRTNFPTTDPGLADM